MYWKQNEIVDHLRRVVERLPFHYDTLTSLDSPTITTRGRNGLFLVLLNEEFKIRKERVILDYFFIVCSTHLICLRERKKHELLFTINRVCNRVIDVYSENKLQHYATAYRNHKGAGEKLCLVSN